MPTTPQGAIRASLRAARRERAGEAVRVLGRALILGSVVSVVLIGLDRVLRLDLAWSWLVAIPVGGACSVASAMVFRRSVGALHGAALLDAAMGSHDRLRNAIALAGDLAGEDEVFASLAIQEGERLASDADPRQAAPVVFGWAWWAGPALLVVAVALGIWLPAWPAGGSGGEGRIPTLAEREAAAAQIEEALASLREAVIEHQEIDAASAEEIERLEALEGELRDAGRDPEEALAEAADALEQTARTLDEEAERALAEREAFEELTRDLQTSDDAMTRELAERLRSGDFAAASEAARELLNQSRQMSPDQRERLANELESLADRLAPEPAPEIEPPQPDPGETDPASGDGPSGERPPTDRPEREPSQSDPSEPRPDSAEGERPDAAPDAEESAERAREEARRLSESIRREAERVRQGADDRPEPQRSPEQGGEEQPPSERPSEGNQQEPQGGEPRSEEGQGTSEQPQQAPEGEPEGSGREERPGGEGAPSGSEGQEPQPAGEQGEGGEPREGGQSGESGGEPKPGDASENGTPGGRPGEGTRPGEQREGSSPGPGEGAGEPLEDQLRRLSEQQRRAERQRDQADQLRDQARRMLGEPEASGDGRGPGDQDPIAERPAPSALDGAPASPVDARPDAATEGVREQVVGDWYSDEILERDPAARSVAGERVREAVRGAERAIEQQRVPRRRRDFLKRVYERYARDVDAAGGLTPAGEDVGDGGAP